ncbi:hypothetical protein RRG08_006767 [Elysia crispata]|uniref:Uncharacterized protein n=1 Tax=Elysia crispata TaxID=231223 RepID=A0AAE0YBA3_9GAST|nr:hypothetical protein RRG08_006767 [Elysia crispata]
MSNAMRSTHTATNQAVFADLLRVGHDWALCASLLTGVANVIMVAQLNKSNETLYNVVEGDPTLAPHHTLHSEESKMNPSNQAAGHGPLTIRSGVAVEWWGEPGLG